MNAFLLAFSIITFLSVCLFLLLFRVQSLQKQDNELERIAIGAGTLMPGFIACFLQVVLLVQLLWSDSGQLNLNLSNSVFLCTFLIASLCLVTSLFIPIVHIVIVAVPLNIAVIIFSVFFPTHEVLLLLPSFSLEVHILLSICAYSTLAFASLIAVLFAIKDWQVKQHKFGVLWKTLPSLQSLESLLFNAIGVGFALLTAGILIGFVDIEKWLTHKVVFSLIAWCVFALLLIGRKMWGWRGKKAIKLTLTGMSFLILSFFGSKFVLEILIS